MISMLPSHQTNISSQSVHPLRILSAILACNQSEKEEALLLGHGLFSFLNFNFCFEVRSAKSELCKCCFFTPCDLSDKMIFKFIFQKKGIVHFQQKQTSKGTIGNIIFCLCLCRCVLPLILRFQLISAKIECFVWICCTSKVTNERKMDPCLDTFNFANWNQASIASSHWIWKPYKVPSHFLGLYRLRGGLCHCLLLVLVLTWWHCLRFELPSWFWKTKPWSTVIKHITVGL